MKMSDSLRSIEDPQLYHETLSPGGHEVERSWRSSPDAESG